MDTSSPVLKIALVGVPGSGPSALSAHLRTRLEPANAYCVMEIPLRESETANCWTDTVEALACVDLILLMGLAPQHHAQDRATDQGLRTALNRKALPYTLVYGAGPVACDNALQAIRHHQRDTTGLAQPRPRWTWPCEKCSDPDCEHRLFVDLLKNV